MSGGAFRRIFIGLRDGRWMRFGNPDQPPRVQVISRSGGLFCETHGKLDFLYSCTTAKFGLDNTGRTGCKVKGFAKQKLT